MHCLKQFVYFNNNLNYYVDYYNTGHDPIGSAKAGVNSNYAFNNPVLVIHVKVETKFLSFLLKGDIILASDHIIEAVVYILKTLNNNQLLKIETGE